MDTKSKVKLKGEDEENRNIDLGRKGSVGDELRSFDNQFEVMGKLPEVNSSVKRNVTQDYTLAWLTDAEREFIEENYDNASDVKTMIEKYMEKGFKYVWDNDKQEWLRNEDRSYMKVALDKDEKALIKYVGELIFERFMILSHMIAVLNRNRKDNFLVKLLGRDMTEEEKAVEDETLTLDKIKKKLKEKGEDD